MARQTGLLHPTDWAPLAPDTVHTIITTAASSAYAVDLPTTQGSTNPTPKFVEIRSGAGGYITWGSTGAIYPSSNLTTSPSTQSLERFLANVPLVRQIPGGSTGYSFTVDSSCIFNASFWGP
jgi:hypothetical protein